MGRDVVKIISSNDIMLIWDRAPAEAKAARSASKSPPVHARAWALGCAVEQQNNSNTQYPIPNMMPFWALGGRGSAGALVPGSWAGCAGWYSSVFGLPSSWRAVASEGASGCWVLLWPACLTPPLGRAPGPPVSSCWRGISRTTHLSWIPNIEECLTALRLFLASVCVCS